jgi:hypothetical protein
MSLIKTTGQHVTCVNRSSRWTTMINNPLSEVLQTLASLTSRVIVTFVEYNGTDISMFNLELTRTSKLIQRV